MSEQVKCENNLVEKMRSISALRQLSEYELKELRHNILSLDYLSPARFEAAHSSDKSSVRQIG